MPEYKQRPAIAVGLPYENVFVWATASGKVLTYTCCDNPVFVGDTWWMTTHWEMVEISHDPCPKRLAEAQRRQEEREEREAIKRLRSKGWTITPPTAPE